jgi:hypothetical protein
VVAILGSYGWVSLNHRSSSRFTKLFEIPPLQKLFRSLTKSIGFDEAQLFCKPLRDKLFAALEFGQNRHYLTA